MNAVSGAVDAIGRGALRKVVLARAKDVRLPQPPNVMHLLRDLRAKNPHGFTFAVSLPRAPAPLSGESGTTLVGASPELLLSRRGALVVSAPLAGSLPRSADASEDRDRAARLLRSAKDRHEHRFVVEQILEGLRPFTTDLHFEREPTVTSTSSMWHLSTRISGTLRDLRVSSLRLALALHPTPAVCGTPTRQAADWIAAAEPFDRGYFTGTLGHMDGTGDGDWIVTIRCAEVGPSGVRVFAGAGVVEHSVPSLELEETEAKMQTMLAALGVGGAS
jgi:isochorismate synthase